MRRAPLAVALGLALAAGLAAAPALAAQEPPAAAAAAATATADPVIVAIEIRGDAPLSEPEEVRSLIALEVGAPLSAAAVERTLRNLRASGVAESASVYRRPAPGAAGAAGEGVVAVVVIEAAILVEEVRIEGDTGALVRADLERLIPQRAGTPLVSDQVVRGVFRLQDELADAGYFERSVRTVPRIDEASRRAVVVYQVEAGPRATVARVEFEGDLGPFAREQLLEPLRLKPGEPFRRRASVGDAGRLRRWLVTEHGHRAAEVDEPKVEVDRETDTVALTFPVEVGPRIEVVIEGADREKLEKEGLLPFLGSEGFDEALLLQAIGGIEAWYQRRGHWEVEATTREETAGGVKTVTLTVVPGPIYALRELRFEGNREVDSGTLRDLVVTGGRSLLGAGRLVDSALEDDLDNVRSYYRLNGWAGAEVGPAVIERVAPEGRQARPAPAGAAAGELTVVVPIVEGPRQRVAALRFEGVAAFEPGEAAGLVPLSEGGPFHPLLLDQSVESLRVAYQRRGYGSVQVSARRSVVPPAASPEAAAREGAAAEPPAEPPVEILVEVTIEVLEGPQTVLDRVIVRGNQRTDEAVIRRAVGVDPGEPVSGALLLEIERRLYRLGIFTTAEAELTPAPLGATSRDLLVRVEEGQTRRLTYGFGYDTEDGFGGIVGYTHGNLFGTGMRLSGDAQVREENQRFRLFVDHPYFPVLEVPVTTSVYRTEQTRESIAVTQIGTRVEAAWASGHTRRALAYTYQNVSNEVIAETVAPEPGDLPDPSDRDEQEQRVSSLTPSLLIDRRNDPIEPSRGWSAGAELEWAFPFPFAAEAEFLKLQLQGTHLFDTGIDLGTGRWVLAASVRAGAIEPLADLDFEDPFIPDDAGFPSSEVFVAERFFAGGRNSHRGFDRDRLGIPGETLIADVDGDLVPAGGTGLLLVNVDLRIPLFGALGGTLFWDTGNVWADWRAMDPSEMRQGAGAGLRYLSPIGPVRLELGWPLDRLPGDDSPVFHFSLGYGF